MRAAVDLPFSPTTLRNVDVLQKGHRIRSSISGAAACGKQGGSAAPAGDILGMDRGARMDVLRVVLAWAAFAVFHSVTVSQGYERRVRRLVGDEAFDAYHRLAFTAYSAVAFVLLLLYLRTVPDPPLYRLEGPRDCSSMRSSSAGSHSSCGRRGISRSSSGFANGNGAGKRERRVQGEPGGCSPARLTASSGTRSTSAVPRSSCSIRFKRGTARSPRR
jgi:hypothetical protein